MTSRKPQTLHYNASISEILSLLNKDYPIDINKLSPIIDVLHEKYPLISKTDITIIVKSIIESLRDLLIMGHIISVDNFFNDLKFHYFRMFKNNTTYFGVKAKCKLSSSLKLL